MAKHYYRIKFLRERGMAGHENLYQESCVVPSELPLRGAVDLILREGFVVPNLHNRGEQITFYDQGEYIMPGAILAIAECDEHGYTPHDRKRAAEEHKERERREKQRGHSPGDRIFLGY